MLSVTLVHPAKADGRNEMPVGRDTRVVQKQGPREIWGKEPIVRSDAAECQIILVLVLISSKMFYHEVSNAM